MTNMMTFLVNTRFTKSVLIFLGVLVGTYVTQLNLIVPRNVADLLSNKSIGQPCKFCNSRRPRLPEYKEEKLSDGSVNSMPGTTGAGVPGALRELLLKETGIEVKGDADDFYGSEEAVQAMESKCRWNAEITNSTVETCFDSMGFVNAADNGFTVDPSLIDIVTSSTRSLDFLDKWREFFQGFNIIIIQDGDPSVKLEIPEWVNFELYNRNDIETALGVDAQWIISSKDASLHNFGFLVSKKPYIYTIDDECLPAKDHDGYFINPIAEHLNNLQSPSNPYFFNTLYDPYHSATDFVRGYPYSLRNGVQTAVSHGLWLNDPNYDAITQLLKPRERNTKLLDMAITVPVNTFYSMSSTNVAFSRELIGPTFMHGLMGEGQEPWGRHDNLLTGLASKAIADHLRYGVKSGMPYVHHNKTSNPFADLKNEYKSLWWQEEITRFFINDVSFSVDADTASKAYIELAHQIDRKFSASYPYFTRLAKAMIVWVELWKKADRSEVRFTPSRLKLSKFKVLNVGARSWFRNSMWSQDSTPDKEFLEILSFWAPQDGNFVNPQDVQIGHKWKTFMYPLPAKFHKDVYKKYIVPEGCIFEACPMEVLEQNPVMLNDQYMDHIAEAVILRKLALSLDFVMDPKDADLILVPALTVTVSHWFEDGSHKGCRNSETCVDEWFTELFPLLSEFKEGGKPHLFLATQDFNQNHRSIMDLGTRSDAIIVNLGPGGLVVPSLDTIPTRQPSKWVSGTPYEDRTIFLVANFAIRDWLHDRRLVSEQLDNYQGSKEIVRVPPDHVGGDIANSIFVLCLAGDLPFTKRIFDTWSSVTIPVVISREFDDGKKSYWHETIWMSGIATVERSYPDFGVNISDIVVEVPRNVLDEPGGIMAFLESISELEIRRKLQRIESMRNYFLYDLEGNKPDAFTLMLQTLSQMLGKE